MRTGSIASNQTWTDGAAYEEAPGRATRASRLTHLITLVAIFAPLVARMELWRSGYIEAGAELTVGARQTVEIACVLFQAGWAALHFLLLHPRRPVSLVRPYAIYLAVLIAINFHPLAAFVAVNFIASVYLIHTYLGATLEGCLRRGVVLLVLWVAVYYADSLAMLVTQKPYFQSYFKTNVHTVGVAALASAVLWSKARPIAKFGAFVVAMGGAVLGESLSAALGLAFVGFVFAIQRLMRLNFKDATIVAGLPALALGLFVLVAPDVVAEIGAMVTGRPAETLLSLTGRRELWSHLAGQFFIDPWRIVWGSGYSTAERLLLVDYFGDLQQRQLLAGVDPRAITPLFQHSHNLLLSALVNGGVIWLAVVLIPIITATLALLFPGRMAAPDWLRATLFQFLLFSIASSGYANRFDVSYLLLAIPLHYVVLASRAQRLPSAARAHRA